MSAVYPKIREQLISWAMNQNAPAGLTFYAIGVDTDYTYSAAHVNLSSVAGAAIIAGEKALSGVTYVNGILDANDVEWTNLVNGDVLDGFIVYLKSGGGDSWLVCYIDSSADSSIPQTIAGSTGSLRFNASGICKI